MRTSTVPQSMRAASPLAHVQEVDPHQVSPGGDQHLAVAPVPGDGGPEGLHHRADGEEGPGVADLGHGVQVHPLAVAQQIGLADGDLHPDAVLLGDGHPVFVVPGDGAAEGLHGPPEGDLGAPGAVQEGVAVVVVIGHGHPVQEDPHPIPRRPRGNDQKGEGQNDGQGQGSQFLSCHGAHLQNRWFFPVYHGGRAPSRRISTPAAQGLPGGRQACWDWAAWSSMFWARMP